MYAFFNSCGVQDNDELMKTKILHKTFLSPSLTSYAQFGCEKCVGTTHFLFRLTDRIVPYISYIPCVRLMSVSRSLLVGMNTLSKIILFSEKTYSSRTAWIKTKRKKMTNHHIYSLKIVKILNTNRCIASILLFRYNINDTDTQVAL